MRYLKDLKIKCQITERGLCYSVRYKDFFPQKAVFDVKLYVASGNTYYLEIWLNGLKVHNLTSYLDQYDTFKYADTAIADIIDRQLGGTNGVQAVHTLQSDDPA